MWKWIGVALLVILLLFVGASWWGYRALTAGGDTVTVTIGASPQRVFASLANYDSLATWGMAPTNAASSRHGTLAPGDTIDVQGSSISGRRSRMSWTATEVTKDRLLVLMLHSDTSDRVVAIRRDSLVARGDSTMIVTTIASPMMESLRSRAAEKAEGRNSSLLDMSSKMLISALRMESRKELTRLKDHIEGRSGTPGGP